MVDSALCGRRRVPPLGHAGEARSVVRPQHDGRWTASSPACSCARASCSATCELGLEPATTRQPAPRCRRRSPHGAVDDERARCRCWLRCSSRTPGPDLPAPAAVERAALRPESTRPGRNRSGARVVPPMDELCGGGRWTRTQPRGPGGLGCSAPCLRSHASGASAAERLRARSSRRARECVGAGLQILGAAVVAARRGRGRRRCRPWRRSPRAARASSPGRCPRLGRGRCRPARRSGTRGGLSSFATPRRCPTRARGRRSPSRSPGTTARGVEGELVRRSQRPGNR